MGAAARAWLLLASLLLAGFVFASEADDAQKAMQDLVGGMLGNLDFEALQACQEDPYFTSGEAEAAQEACDSITSPTSSCPAPCAKWLQGIPAKCKEVFASIWSAAGGAMGDGQDMGNAIDWLNEACGTDFTVNPNNDKPGTSPPKEDQSPPPEDESPPPEDESPPPADESPAPEDESPPPFTPPNFTSDFACNGSFSWISLDPDAASQWGVDPLAPDSGPQNAVAGNCTNLFLDKDNTPSGCCSQTQPDLSTWWQYELPKAMKVKGVRLVAPTDSTCCVDVACTEQEPCYNRLLDAQIAVGNMSLPNFYDSTEYKDLLAVYMNNATLAQAGVWSLLLSNSSLCNFVSTNDLLSLDEDTLIEGGANIGCGLGVVGTSVGTVEPVGRYISLAQIGSPPISLALCGIEICASPIK